MQIRCQRCNHMFTLSRDAILAAQEEIEQTQSKHYNVECPKCRRQVKVPVKDFRRLPAVETDKARPAKSPTRGRRRRTRRRK
jgi:DNA-directed RNA polymerase subunit RPC12/RpoP